MTENKTIVEKVTSLLAKFSTDATEVDNVEKFEDVKTTDGVVLRISELAEGGTVSIISEDGESVGSGDYVLEDGTTISVGEDGVITSVTPSEAEEEVEEEMGEEEKAKDDAPAEEEEEEDGKPSKFEAEMTETLLSIVKVLDGFEAKFATVDTDLKKLGNEPEEEEFSVGKKGKKVTKESAIDALATFRSKQK